MLFKKKSQMISEGEIEIWEGIVRYQNFRLNVYCFAADGVLIDTGAQSLAKEFRTFAEKVKINQAVLTHNHEDHTGGAAFLQKELGLPVYIRPSEIGICSRPAAYPLYRKMFWGKRRPFEAKPLGETFESDHAVWDVIPTPGHSPDHVSFLNRETGQLFTGDLYCQEKTKVVLREEKIPQIKRSLKRVLDYDFGEVFCCHAGVLPEGRQALSRKLAYLTDLEGRVLHLDAKGYSAEQIKEELFPKKYPITRFSFGEWDSIHIVNSILQEKQAESHGVQDSGFHQL